MKVIMAPALGFCKGVDNAVRKAEIAVEERRGKENIYFFGNIVHNNKVVDSLLSKGGKVVFSPDEVDGPGCLIVRAHGITDSLRSGFEAKGLEIIDCTCPVVLRGQSLVRESEKPVLILGYKGHSEVDSLFGSAPHNAIVISVPEDLDRVEKGSYRAVVQTTFSISRMEKILEKAREKGIEIDKANSICLASVSRRNGVRRIADEVEAFVVVGSSHSANTRELVETASRLGKPSFLAEDCESIPDEVFSYGIIGLTAGASTPYEEYIKVKERLESYDNG